MRKPFFLVGLLLACTLSFSGCKSKRPSEVIAPDVMEKLLYDYHLAQAWSNEFNGEERYKRELIQQFVFDKYGVDRAQFDSSMVWYSRHTKQLDEIYQHLGDRMQADCDRLSLLTGTASASAEPISGDSVDLWQNRVRTMEITTAPLTNKQTFTMTADTAFHARDKFRWNFDAHFVSSAKHKPTTAIAELAVYYQNDSVLSLKHTVKEGHNRILLKSDSLTIREVRGVLYYASEKSDAPVRTLWVTNTELLRIHLNEEELEAARRADSLRVVTDSVKVDSNATGKQAPVEELEAEEEVVLDEASNRRLSPQELRQLERPKNLQKKVVPKPHVNRRRQ